MSDQVETRQARDLEKEIRALRQRVEQREHALGVLNRRLIQLERNDVGQPGRERAGAWPLDAENEDLRQQRDAAIQQTLAAREESAAALRELEAMRATRLFRWASPARQVYAKTRGLR
jgi:hypothetical protein